MESQDVQKLRNSKFELLQMPPMNTQSVLLTVGDECVVFDAWGHVSDWSRIIDGRGLNLRAIYTTHGHPDHISAAPALAKKYGVPWYLHSGDFRMVGWGNGLLTHFGLPEITTEDVRPTLLDIKSTMVLSGVLMNIVETPGHSPGGVAYHFPDEKLIIIGDTLFQESIGRYDLPGGDKNVLFQSISNLYKMNLSDDTEVVHGHGMATDIKYLKQNNPYFHS